MTTTRYTLLLLCLCIAAMASAQHSEHNRTTTVSGATTHQDTTKHHSAAECDIEQTINEIIVTGVAGSTALNKTATAMAVIGEEELRQKSYSNIIDAVATQPGVSQVTTGSGISKPVIRGLGYNRIVVLNDGVKQEGQQWGDEHGIEIDAQSVSSVEILKGPASLMYGSDAMAGVLIFNDAPTLPNGTVKGAVGLEHQTNNGLLGATLSLGGHHNHWLWDMRYSDKRAHAYKNRHDGYVYNSGFAERAAGAMVGYTHSLGATKLKLDLYHITPGIVEGDRDEETGAFTKVVALNGEEAEAVATHKDYTSYAVGMPRQKVYHYKAVLDNSLQVAGGTVKLLLGYQHNRRQEYEDVLEPDECELDMLLHTATYSLNWQTDQWQGWRMAAGVNGMWQRSENRGEECLIPDYCLADGGIYATMAKELGRANISGGLRYDHRQMHSYAMADEEGDGEQLFSDFRRSFNGMTGSLGVAYNATDRLTLRANISRGFRTPNISELASNGVHEGTIRYEIGNSSLRPESSWQTDLGADYSSARLTARLALFANFISNYIFSERVAGAEIDGYAVYQFVAGDARLMGGEASIDWHIVEPLHFENTFSYVSATQQHQPTESRYLPFTPAPRWTSTLRLHVLHDSRHFHHAFVALSMDCNLRQSHYYAVNDTETATPSYTLFNMTIGTDIMAKGRRIATLCLTGTNLTDRAYQNHLSRLKYTAENNATGRRGIYNMGRNVGIKVTLPIVIQ